MSDLKVSLLGTELLSNQKILDEVAYWLHVMKRPHGWHYDMDEVWMLESLERANVPKGATILDAGAGLGVMQFVLAARGYNVVSLDFGKRAIPAEADGIFNIELQSQEDFEYKHAYQKFVIHSAGSVTGEGTPDAPSLFDRLSAPDLLSRVYHKIRREILHKVHRLKEKSRNRDHYGKITFVRAAFHDIPFDDSYFDAVVSVSALEHADVNLLDDNLNEIVRVVKANAPVLISTSAIGSKEDHFDEITQGWCFSSQTMSRFADNALVEFEKCSSIEESIMHSSIWNESLDSCYFLDANSPFYKKQMTTLPYLPVGLSRAGL